MLVEGLMAGLEIDFAKFLITIIHDRALMTSITYPFTCLIFYFCRDVGVTLWHCDTLCCLTGRVDVGHIRDETNLMASLRGP